MCIRDSTISAVEKHITHRLESVFAVFKKPDFCEHPHCGFFYLSLAHSVVLTDAVQHCLLLGCDSRILKTLVEVLRDGLDESPAVLAKGFADCLI